MPARIEQKPEPLKVFIASRESKCGECQRELGHHSWITLAGDKGALCLACADLDHLVFLPAGDTALTRRAQKHSRLSAVVLEWSRARKRYERQGLLVEEEALAQAEGECLADAEARARRQEREAAKRAGPRAAQRHPPQGHRGDFVAFQNGALMRRHRWRYEGSRAA